MVMFIPLQMHSNNVHKQQRKQQQFEDPYECSCGKKEIVCCCLFLCIFFTIVYIPIYISAVQWRENEALVRKFPWKENSTRDVSVYVHPDNVTAIIANEEFCKDDPPFLLIVVCSAVGNFKARQALRETWMSQREPGGNNRTADVIVRTVFLLGETDDNKHRMSVLDESNIHGDIIQEAFHDTYLNLTLKSVMMLKWVKTHCPLTTFVLKTDDDMFVNVGILVDYLSQPQMRYRKDLIVGALLCRNPIDKNLKSKWYSPLYMFTDKVYPDFVSGTGYVLSGALIPVMFEKSLKVPLFHLEDVFLTGIVAQHLNITVENYHLFSSKKEPLITVKKSDRQRNLCRYRNLITSHSFNPESLKMAWRKVSDPKLDCSNSTGLPQMRDPNFKTCKNQTLKNTNKIRPN